ncbi:MAG: NAD(P)/FAD-dependent oxidoreductase, partial [Flavobacteriaceae bacterium]|nr:NAD(P)/FAD-dependent oxidoreductase [Flavobacteriaceae bacterium]
MGETVARTITGNRTPYSPGYWFNSAKFLEIEYQTYGWVFSDRHKKDSEQHFHWRHPKKNIAITIAYHRDSKLFLGINTFGIRMRHHVFNHWLKAEKDVMYVVSHLKDANFDPEFYAAYESEIVASFNQQLGADLRPQSKSWKRILNLS